MLSAEGVCDRMRSAAFAEWQAVQAFAWASDSFTDAPAGLLEGWRRQIPDEQRHYQMIIERMGELGAALDERPVSTGLWRAISRCTSAREFGVFIASAEERGRLAALRLVDNLLERDPVTAGIFRSIAEDEIAHVALAERYFGTGAQTK
jgi:uncharacterized ferritin-like protein (DUF455 family)